MKNIPLTLSLMLLASCTPKMIVTVSNTAPFGLDDEMIEVDAERVTNRLGNDFTVVDENGVELPTQITYDGKILFQASLKPQSDTKFKITRGVSVKSDTICVGQIRPDLQDDYAWENDHGGYRLYGPSYRAKGGNVSGYDIWTKSVPYPVLKQRYDDHCRRGVSYHKDHGSGMDAYTVGRTLGAGMNALVVNDTVCYPCAYEKCEILDNGPLRVTARITCYPMTVECDSNVIETRMITLDKGSWLNRVDVSYANLSRDYELVTGIVVHKQNTRGYAIDKQKRYVSYADLTDNPDNGNGVIYIGIVNAETIDSAGYTQFVSPVGDATGQVMNHTMYTPSTDYTYYWGAGWSKGGIRGLEEWDTMLANFHSKLQYPVIVKLQ